jgi:hypothetical protein
MNAPRKRLVPSARLGPRPILVERYFSPVAAQRLRKWKLRRSYSHLITQPGSSAKQAPGTMCRLLSDPVHKRQHEGATRGGLVA